MADKAFKQIRSLRALDEAAIVQGLTNHQKGLQTIAGWCQRFGHEHFYVRVWMVVVTVAIIYLAVRG